MAIRYLSGINVDSNTLFVDDANNRVGIGTASPTQALDVTGRAYISSGASIGTTSTAGTGLTVNGSTVLLSFVEIQQGNLLYLYSSGNTYYSQIYQSGQNLILSPYSNVGIGTTSPAVKFVVSNAGASGFEVDPTGGVGGGPVLQAYNRSTSAYMAQSYYALSHTFNVGSGGSTRAVDITSAGDVAINTTDNALAKLRVVGNGGAGNSAIMADYGNTSVLGEVSMISYRNSAWHTLYVKETGSSATNAVLVEGTKPVIFNAGDVGIGTTSPASKLDVYGIISLNGYNVLQEFGSNNVYANVRVIRNTSSVYGDGMYVNYNSVGTTSAHLRFFANGTSERMRIDASTGNVGIGTTSPVTKLHVVEDSNSSTTYPLILNNRNNQAGDGWGAGLKFSTSTPEGGGNEANKWSSIEAFDVNNFGSSSGLSFTVSETYTKTKAMVITRTGAVGIGTTSPSQKLHVVGVGRFDNIGAQLVLGTSGVAGAYEFSTTTGNALVISLSGVNERMRIDSSGNVGIGTTNIYENLTVSNSSGASIGVGTGGAAGTGASPLYTYFNFRGYGDYIKGQISSYDVSSNFVGGVLIFSVQNTSAVLTERMRISSAGALKLNAYGSGSNTGTATQRLAVDASGNVIEIPIGSGPVDGNGTANYITRWSDADTITNSIIYDNGTNVGIGTTSPSYKLDVSGTARTTQSTYLGTASGNVIVGGTSSDVTASFKFISIGNSAFQYGASTGNYLRIEPGDANTVLSIKADARSGAYPPLAFFTSDTERLRILANGNVGIGTTSPVEKLDVRGGAYINGGTNDNTYDATLYVTAASSNDWGIFVSKPGYDYGIISQVGNGAYYGLSVYDGTTHNFVVKGNGTTLIQGNVGIGTTSPGYKLDVAGSTNVSSTNFYRYDGDTGIFGSGTSISGGTANQLGIRAANEILFATNGATEKMRLTTGGQLIVGGTTVGYSGTKLQVGNTSDSQNGLNILTSTTGYGYILFGDGAGADTYVGQIWYYHGDNYMGFQTNGGERMRITSSGNVGIGTTSPASALQIGSVGSTGYSVGNGLAFGDGTRAGALNVDSNGTTLYSSTNLIFSPGTTEAVRIISSGNVGIGTTSPSTKLHVVGYSRTDGGILVNGGVSDYREIIFTTSAAARWNLYAYGAEGGGNAGSVLNLARYADDGSYLSGVMTFLRTNGYVGVNTSSPTQQLHVTGNVRVTGAYYDSNNSAGSSGQVLSSTGSGTDWVSLSEITGVDGTGTANYVAKWSDTDTITNSSITDNGTTVTATVDRLNMNKQAGIYVFSKTVGASASSAFFSISNLHGAQAFRVTFVCSTSGYSVAKTYEVVHIYGTTPVYSKVVDSGPFGSEDFDVLFTNSNSDTGCTATVTNNSTTTAGNIVATVFLGGGAETITVTAL